MRKFFLLTGVGLMVLFLSECVPAIPMRTGRPLKDDKILTITPGKTTKQDIIELFGAPMAIAKQGEVLKIQSERTYLSPKSSYYEIDSDTFFELFSSQHTLTEYHRIYYYYHAVSKETGLVLGFFIYENGKTIFYKLWILVNEETGMVEDYVFRKH
jgi:hypothetical protein